MFMKTHRIDRKILAEICVKNERRRLRLYSSIASSPTLFCLNFKDQVEDAFLSVFVEVRVLFRQSLAMNGRSSPHKPF